MAASKEHKLQCRDCGRHFTVAKVGRGELEKVFRCPTCGSVRVVFVGATLTDVKVDISLKITEPKPKAQRTYRGKKTDAE